MKATRAVYDVILPAESILRTRAVQHVLKRLEFRIDPTRHDVLHTRIDELIDAMADIHRIERVTFRRKTSRDPDLLLAQQTAWWIMRTRWAFPHHVIAAYFEHHRSTVISGIQAVQDAADSDLAFATWLDLLPFWMNIDVEGGRIEAISAVFQREVGKDADEWVKTQQRARKGPKKGILGEGQ